RVRARHRADRLCGHTHHRSAHRNGEHEHQRSNPRPPHHLSYNPNSTRKVRLQTGPDDSVAVRGSVRSSRITFSDSSKNLFKYQFTPVVQTRSAVGKTSGDRGPYNAGFNAGPPPVDSRSRRAPSSIAPYPPLRNGRAGVMVSFLCSPVASQVPLTYHARSTRFGRSSSSIPCPRRVSRTRIASACTPIGPGRHWSCAPSRWRRPFTYTFCTNASPGIV